MSEFEKIRYTRQKDFDINNKQLIDFEFEGKKKKVYNNCNLSIFVDDYCNADCKFCVAQLRYENISKAYEKPKIDDDSEYFRRLDEVLSYIEPLNVSVSITGGEPTVSPRLIKILELIDKHNMRKRVITTNGSYLLNKINEKTVLDYLIENKFDHFELLNQLIQSKQLHYYIYKFLHNSNNQVNFYMEQIYYLYLLVSKHHLTLLYS